MKTKIIDILNNAAVAKGKVEGLADALLNLFNENRVSGESHPPKTVDGKLLVWCSRHQQYHESEYMVPNKSKECGFANYCKAAQRRWEWMHRHSQLLSSISARLHQDGKHDDASTIYFLADTLKVDKNKAPATYADIEVDDSIDEVVQSCKDKWYTPDIVAMIPEDLRKSVGLATK